MDRSVVAAADALYANVYSSYNAAVHTFSASCEDALSGERVR